MPYHGCQWQLIFKSTHQSCFWAHKNQIHQLIRISFQPLSQQHSNVFLTNQPFEPCTFGFGCSILSQKMPNKFSGKWAISTIISLSAPNEKFKQDRAIDLSIKMTHSFMIPMDFHGKWNWGLCQNWNLIKKTGLIETSHIFLISCSSHHFKLKALSIVILSTVELKSIYF